MKYTEWKFLFPPRPESALPPDSLNYYEEKMKWVAQFKKNGTNTIIMISPEKEFKAMNRHKDDHKAWQLTSYIQQELVRLFPEPCWIVLCAEIMHSKTQTIKDTIYIHDILVFDNNYMVGSTFMDRQKILDAHLKTNVETKSHYVCDNQGKVWYAKLYTNGFEKLFFDIKDPKIDEGLVLKNPEGKLKICDKPASNSSWSAKVRHATKSYNF